jgi:hypothetical protein
MLQKVSELHKEKDDLNQKFSSQMFGNTQAED